MLETLPTPDACPTCEKALSTPEKRWLYCSVCGGFPQDVESPTDFFVAGVRFQAGKYRIRKMDNDPPDNAMTDEEWEAWEVRRARQSIEGK